MASEGVDEGVGAFDVERKRGRRTTSVGDGFKIHVVVVDVGKEKPRSPVCVRVLVYV